MNTEKDERIETLESRRLAITSKFNAIERRIESFEKFLVQAVQDNFERLNASLLTAMDDFQKEMADLYGRCSNVQLNLSESQCSLYQKLFKDKQLVRLVNGGFLSGRLEVNIGGEWGTVCDDNFDSDDADVVCKQLGYSSGVVKTNAFFGQGSLEILMDNVDCIGTELTIQNCRYNGKETHNCDHDEDVGVMCL